MTKEQLHIKKLYDSGMQYGRIALAAGLHRHTIRRVLGGITGMNSANSDRLLAVKPLRKPRK